MTKGEKLEALLNQESSINQQMDAIFKRYNVPFLDLRNLPDEGKEEWDCLFKQKDEITDQIGRLFK